MVDSRQHQDLQIRNSRNYDDTLTPGVTLVTDAEHLEDDLNAGRTIDRLISGEPNHFDAPACLNLRQMQRRVLESTLTIPTGCFAVFVDPEVPNGFELIIEDGAEVVIL